MGGIETRYDYVIEQLREAAQPDRVAPTAAGAYLEKVRRAAYSVTDADVAELEAAGLAGDEIFELTVTAAVGVGLDRLSAGLRALE